MKTPRLLLAFAALTTFALVPFTHADDAKKSENTPAACCKKSAEADKACTHGCCVTAAKEKKNCEKCGGQNAPKPETTS